MKTPYYSVKETSEKLGINPSLVMRKIKAGEIKATKIGWVWACERDSVDKLAKTLDEK